MPRHAATFVLVWLLAGCAVLPTYDEVPLAELKVRHGDRFVGYLDAVGPLPAPAAAPLPTAPVQAFELPEGFKGWALYDANADGVIDDGEQTVAWLERLHALRLETRARLLRPDGKPAGGIALSAVESARVRAALEADEAGRALVEATARYLADLRSHRNAISSLVLWPAAR